MARSTTGTNAPLFLPVALRATGYSPAPLQGAESPERGKAEFSRYFAATLLLKMSATARQLPLSIRFQLTTYFP